MEAHPYFTQKDLRKTLDEYDIKLMSWYPLGHGDKALINEPIFAQIGEKYGKSPAQVILRWHTQTGFVVIPGSRNVDHIDELTDVAKQEQNENTRPAIAGEVPDLSRYSTVFIGAPVWWGDWPMIMYTFFEENADALAGKTLIPFSTHAGSGLSGFDSKLESACPESTVGEGLAIAGKDAQKDQENVRSEVNEWLEGLGF